MLGFVYLLTYSFPCGTGAAVAAASAASSSSFALGTSLDPHQHCLLAQSPQQQRSRLHCQPQTCWSQQSGTGGRCWSLLRVWKEKSHSSDADVGNLRHSRRCGTPHCWTARHWTALVEAYQWKQLLTGSWCCRDALSVLRTGAWEGSRVESGLTYGPGSCWVKQGRPLGPHLECFTERQSVTANLRITELYKVINILHAESNVSFMFCLVALRVSWYTMIHLVKLPDNVSNITL